MHQDDHDEFLNQKCFNKYGTQDCSGKYGDKKGGSGEDKNDGDFDLDDDIASNEGDAADTDGIN